MDTSWEDLPELPLSSLSHTLLLQPHSNPYKRPGPHEAQAGLTLPPRLFNEDRDGRVTWVILHVTFQVLT